MDLSQFKEKFIEEAFGLIKNLEESLLDQEDNLENKENVQEIFRVLHTLKGISAMYGFIHIGDLVHDLESIFDLIREDKQNFTKEIFEITLKTVDHLRNLLNDETLQQTDNQKAQKELLTEISKIVTEVNSNQNIPKKTTTPPPVKENPKETFYIIFYPTESQLFRCINILQIFHDLAELGEFKIVNHAFNEQDQEGKQGQKQSAWGIYLVTSQGISAIEDVFLFVSDDCKILKISNHNLFDHEEFTNHLDSAKNIENKPDSISIQQKIEKTISAINIQETTSKPITNTEPIAVTPPEEAIEKPTIKKNPLKEEKENIKTISTQTTDRINIDASKLDRLMYLVSELVITKSQLNLVVENKDYTKLIQIAEKIDNLAYNFRDNALDIRLIPVAEMIVPFKRMIRDLSKDLGKEVKFTTQGIETELDKNVMDRLAEPIMHILRNGIDHGIETPEDRAQKGKTTQGNIKLSSFYSGANVIIQIEDDGSGIDTEKIRLKGIEKGFITAEDKLKKKEILDLIFAPGFSMAHVISEISGRGVGMDVVRKKINDLRGEVEITSELGKGTTVTIKLHQTLSIIDTLLIKVEKTHYLVPLSDIEFCEQEKHEILYKNQNRLVEIKNELVPFVSLRDLFSHNKKYPKKEKLVIINKNNKRVAIVADEIVGEHQAVLKPLGELFQAQKYLSGASFLGDGSLALMLDTTQIHNKKANVENL